MALNNTQEHPIWGDGKRGVDISEGGFSQAMLDFMVGVSELEQVPHLLPEELYMIMEEIDDPIFIREIVKARFMSEATMDNHDVDNPYIIWEAMNRHPQPWVALALAKIAKAELNINPDDIILFVPSSGSWLSEEFYKVFPDNYFPILKKEEDLILPDNEKGLPPDEIYYRFPVRSHKNGRKPRMMFLCTPPNHFSGKRIKIIDDVLARADALIDVMGPLDELGVNGYDEAVVMDKRMQQGYDILTSDPSPVGVLTSLVVVKKVVPKPGGYDFILA